MVLTFDEMTERLKNYVDGDTDDDLAFIEDVLDTVKANTNEDVQALKDKIEQIDKQWREKYKARFFDEVKVEDTVKKEDDTDVVDDGDEDERVVEYDDLFKEVDDNAD